MDPTADIHIAHKGKQRGPFTIAQVVEMTRRGSIDRTARFHRPGMTEWASVELLLNAQPTPPPALQPASPVGSPTIPLFPRRPGCIIRIGGSFLVLFGLVVVVAMVNQCEKDAAAELIEEAKKAKTQAEEDGRLSALTMAQVFAKKGLRSPGTADFGSVFGGTYQGIETVERLGPDKYRVRGWVDSQNTFGATVRATFDVTLRGPLENDNWRMLEGPNLVQR